LQSHLQLQRRMPQSDPQKTEPFALYFCDEMQKHQMIQCAVLQLRGKQYFIISIPHTQKNSDVSNP